MNRITGAALSLLAAAIFGIWYGLTLALSGASWYVPTATYFPSAVVQGLVIALAFVFGFWALQRLLRMDRKRLLFYGITLGFLSFAFKLGETDTVGTVSAVFDGLRLFVVFVFAAWGVSRITGANTVLKSQVA